MSQNNIEFKYLNDRDYTIPVVRVELSDGSIHYLSEKNPNFVIPAGLTAKLFYAYPEAIITDWNKPVFQLKGKVNESEES